MGRATKTTWRGRFRNYHNNLFTSSETESPISRSRCRCDSKLTLSVYIIKHQTMKVYGEVEIQLHFSLDGGE